MGSESSGKAGEDPPEGYAAGVEIYKNRYRQGIESFPGQKENKLFGNRTSAVMEPLFSELRQEMAELPEV